MSKLHIRGEGFDSAAEIPAALGIDSSFSSPIGQYAVDPTIRARAFDPSCPLKVSDRTNSTLADLEINELGVLAAEARTRDQWNGVAQNVTAVATDLLDSYPRIFSPGDYRYILATRVLIQDRHIDTVVNELVLQRHTSESGWLSVFGICEYPFTLPDAHPDVWHVIRSSVQLGARQKQLALCDALIEDATKLL